MNKIPVIAIFDVGKTNKKLLLFDVHYQVVYESAVQFTEISDEDGFPCEDVHALTRWLRDAFDQVVADQRFDVRAVNFSGYGASFVYLDANGTVVAPLYNYLKPYPEQLKQQLYQTYGGESFVSKQTASPVLGSLNSGMQLYRLKYEQPELFARIAVALHLPQYLSYVLTGQTATDITSIGCHTGLWNFEQNSYHRWVTAEGIAELFAPILPYHSYTQITRNNKTITAGYGLHDSSAALIPYLASVSDPFVLLSTGTWCISLNPFNHTLLTEMELQNDCLCFLSYTGNPVKASRLFAGYEHEQQIKRLAAYFHQPADYYTTVQYDPAILKQLKTGNGVLQSKQDTAMLQQSAFDKRSLDDFSNYEAAYHQLMADLVAQQVASTQLVLNGSPVKQLFVDGGFGKNPVYMHLLAAAFPQLEVAAATVAQASALGAALALHDVWNRNPLPAKLVHVQRYTP